MKQLLKRIPIEWSVVDLSEVCQIVRGVTFPASAKNSAPGVDLVPCLRTSNVQEVIELSDLIYIDREFVKREDQWIAMDDIVMSMANSHELVGKVALIEADLGEMSFGGFLSVFRAYGIDPRFLFFMLRSSSGRRALRARASRTVNISNLSLKRLENFPLPLPHLNEQRRIVGKIEALQARSRKAREALNAVPALLEKFRQSVLAAAFRGDLTADWREQNPDVEPASELLERIRVERRARWEEAELAKMEAKGKTPKNDKWKEKYKEPEPVDTTGLPELPQGWCWARLDEIASVIDPNPSHRYPSYNGGTIPLLATQEFDGLEGWNPETAKLIPRDFFEYQRDRCDFASSDIIMARKGRLGLARRSPPLKEYAFSHTVFVIKPERSLYSDLVLWKLRRNSTIAWLTREMNSNTGVPTLGKATTEKLPIPVPPYQEQVAVCDRIDAAVSSAIRLEEIIREKADSLNELDESILAKAFRGELVPQDPNDEPASVLLERIREERAKHEKPKRRARKKKSKA